MDFSFFTHIIEGLLGVGLLFVGWFSNQVWLAVQTLKKELNDLQLMLVRDYVRHDRLKEAFEPIMSALEEIKATLKTKADKP